MTDDATAAAKADAAVIEAGEAARTAAGPLLHRPAADLDQALRSMADRLTERAGVILAANELDVEAATAAGLAAGFVDRLALTEARIGAMAGQLRTLADVPAEPAQTRLRDLPGDLELHERRRPVGVVGANFEARPNVVVDVASQLIKSRNAGVLRTGSSAVRSAAALIDDVVRPAMRASGLDPAAIQLLRVAGRDSAFALVRQPRLVPLVILRGSGDSTRALAHEAALHGVRTLAHADGGGVLYLDESADLALAHQLIESSLDRLGVCNRLNLLLVHDSLWDTALPGLTALAARLGVAVSLPPHRHPLGHEWALDAGAEATITVAPAAGPEHAAEIANHDTSGLAAAIVAADAGAARVFLDRYAGTGAFWNASTRLLDGFKLLSLPETGINIDVVPGPRGPVTFRDLYLRQYVVAPGDRQAGRARLSG
jgi:glutamate-5-semialdehyde dehydrogenase